MESNFLCDHILHFQQHLKESLLNIGDDLKIKNIMSEVNGISELLSILMQNKIKIRTPFNDDVILKYFDVHDIEQINMLLDTKYVDDIIIDMIQKFNTILATDNIFDDVINDLLTTLTSALNGAIMLLDYNMQYIKQQIYCDYDEMNVAIVMPEQNTLKNILPKQFQENIGTDTKILFELLHGYDGLLTDYIITLTTFTQDYEKINKIEHDIVSQLAEHIEIVLNYIKQTRPPKNKDDHSIVISTQHNDNIIYTIFKQKKEQFVSKWYDYQQHKNRCYLSYIYYVYCLVNTSHVNATIYHYIDADTVRHYIDILKDISDKFSQKTEINAYIKYFNIFHYYTIKLLKKFFDEIIKVFNENELIDIFSCREDVRFAFIIFNNFKIHLDTYHKIK